MSRTGKLVIGLLLTAILGLAFAVACGDTKEVIKEIKVPGETIIVEKEVVKEVMVPGETVVVEKEVVKEVMVPGETVVVEKEVVKQVEVEKIVEKVVVKQIGGPSGHLVSPQASLPSINGWTSACGPTCWNFALLDIGETLLQGGRNKAGSYVFGPKVASSWTMASDFSYTDFTIKEGNYFHKGWGEVTAEDVVYSANEGDNRWASQEAKDLANPINNRAFPDLAYGKWEVLSKFEVRQPWADGHPPIKGLFEVSNDAYPWGVHSKKLYDEKGWEYARDNMVGSGPYEVEYQKEGERWTMIARQDGLEDEKIPDVLRYTQSLVPENGTRLALLEAGEAAIMCCAGSADQQRLFKQGRTFQPLPNGSVNGITFHFLGNYWETTHPKTGEPLVRSVVRDMPWICPPGDDLANPHISECNDVAKLYRQALLMAVDRQALVDGWFPGGSIILSAPINLADPMIDKYGDIWGDRYNPEKAKEIMAEWRVKYAALGKDPDSVENHYWTNMGWQPGVEIDQAIAANWEEIFGIPTVFDTRPWPVWSPDAWYNRKGFRMQATAAATYRGNLMNWDNESRWSGYAAPDGRNMGWETPFASRILKAKQAAWNDPAERERLTVEWMEHIYDQHMRIGLLEGPGEGLYNADIIAGFSDRVPGIPYIIWDLAYVTLRK